MMRYLELPRIPDSIIDNLPTDWDQYDRKVSYPGSNYAWTDSFNQEINSWCQQNISPDMYFGFQIMSGDVPIHRDHGTRTKLVYLIYPGGKSVATNFYSDQQELAQSYVINTNRWHVLQTDCLHSVDGIEAGQFRFSVTGRIFP
jgi:hypothetical protein